MLSKKYFGLGAIGLAVAIALTEFLNLSDMLHYLWALVALVWGFLALIEK